MATPGRPAQLHPWAGIRGRLAGTYFLLVAVTVLLISVALLTAVRQYYLGNIRDILDQQAGLAAQFYQSYLGKNPLVQEAPDLAAAFSATTAAAVQVLDSSGRVLADSTAASDRPNLSSAPDVARALAGKAATYSGSTARGEPYLAVAAPLAVDGTVQGAIRFVTSLAPLEALLGRLAGRLALLGILLILVMTAVGFVLAHTIVEPVQELTCAARRIAGGDLTVRARRHFRDEIGTLAETLNYMAAELARLDQLKKEFISSVSHELRTPLTAIRGWAASLKEGSVDPAYQEQGLTIIAAESERLTGLVEELLDFSRLEAGKLTLRRERVALPPLLQNTVAEMQPRARRLGLTLTLDVPPALPEVNADPARLRQVLVNLLDNALKFTPAGGTVRVFAGLDAPEGRLTFGVADTGPGFTSEELARLGRRFAPGSRPGAGSGLGLALVKEILALHGGELKAESAPGQGATVRCTLPLDGMAPSTDV